MILLRQIVTALVISAAVASAAWSLEPSETLDKSCDPRLQQGLNHCLTALGLEGAVREKSLSVVLVDITDPGSPRMAFANPDDMLYAASLPKIGILLGAFERIGRGEMALDAPTLATLKRMIRRSSNEAATEMLNRVGPDFLISVLQSPRYALYDPATNGGVWVGKAYSKGAAYRRDPLHHLSHGATAFQVARFYYLLETGRLVSPELSRVMKSILGEPEINHKFVKGLQSTHPEARIYRKSGTWQDFHSDSAIVEHDGRRYIAVALSHHPDGGRWLSELIVGMDDLVCRPMPAPAMDRPDFPRMAGAPRPRTPLAQ
jgi:beta-lactamase class A